jgi:biotin-(acetyl-CoA carboxylase) ligase
VCKGTDSPRGEQEVQHPEENECTWSDEENEQLCSAAKEHQEKGRTREGEHWRKKERGATTISLPPMPSARKEQGKQNVEWP